MTCLLMNLHTHLTFIKCICIVKLVRNLNLDLKSLKDNVFLYLNKRYFISSSRNQYYYDVRSDWIVEIQSD